ncbi:DUF421 domain-containing protein [Bacillus sp. OTU530]|uniref:DUF421 domain-containing protein n=1 Tax=Bacillus sp. OTU530 TaxID=3043862 RepID=UPI00313DF63E
MAQAYMGILELIVRITLTYAVLLGLTRLMGRKEIGQTTFFNFVSAITIGAIGGAVVVDATLPLRNGIIALVGWSAITIALGFLDIKSKKVRLLIEGEPAIVIKDGKVMENTLRKARLDMDALNALLRKKDIFSLSDVSYAIFEVNGELTVIKKENKLVTAPNIHIRGIKQNVLPMALELIAEGKMNKENAQKLHVHKDWLEQQLHQIGIQSISDVFYAEVQQDGTLYIDKRNDILH